MDKLANKKLLIIAYTMISIQFLCYAFNVWLPLKILVTLLTKHPSGMLFIMINLKIISTLVPKEHQITALAFDSNFKKLKFNCFSKYSWSDIRCCLISSLIYFVYLCRWNWIYSYFII